MSDLVIPESTESQSLEPLTLDTYAALVLQEEFLRKTVKEWTEQLEAVQAQIQEVMGARESAVFAGREVFTWKYIDNINETNFKKAFPELHRAYTKIVEVDKLDRELLRVGQPDIYRRFQTRQFKRVS